MFLLIARNAKMNSMVFDLKKIIVHWESQTYVLKLYVISGKKHCNKGVISSGWRGEGWSDNEHNLCDPWIHTIIMLNRGIPGELRIHHSALW